MKPENALIYTERFKLQLGEALYYIANVLQNPDAAERLAGKVKSAIYQRLQSPASFEPYRSIAPLKFTYYRIYVDNYTVFYYFNNGIMYVSHFIFSSSDIPQKLK